MTFKPFSMSLASAVGAFVDSPAMDSSPKAYSPFKDVTSTFPVSEITFPMVKSALEALTIADSYYFS